MKKLLIVTTLLFLFTSCSGNETKNLVFQNFDSKKTELNLEKKDLKEVPKFSSMYWDPILNKITSIKLWDNKLTKINIDDFKLLPNLNNIDLSNNTITSVQIDLKLLKTINLSNNKIITWTWFVVWESIKNVNLSNNWLIDLIWFNNYKNLVAIDLSNNKLKDNDLKVFGWNKKLKYLFVTWNNINKELLKKIESINKKYLSSKMKNLDNSIDTKSIKISTWSVK